VGDADSKAPKLWEENKAAVGGAVAAAAQGDAAALKTAVVEVVASVAEGASPVPGAGKLLRLFFSSPTDDRIADEAKRQRERTQLGYEIVDLNLLPKLERLLRDAGREELEHVVRATGARNDEGVQHLKEAINAQLETLLEELQAFRQEMRASRGRGDADRAAMGGRPPGLPVDLRVFLSSPGDVAEERAIARRIMDRIPREPLVRGKVTLEVVAWDDPEAPPPQAAGETPQWSVNRYTTRPSGCDLTVVILWSRLGTPLPPEAMKPDGTTFASGTEWEFEDARGRGRETWLYQRTEEPRVGLRDPKKEEKEQQYEALMEFIGKIRSNGDGSAKGGINQYASPTDFEELFEKHFEAYLRHHIDQVVRVGGVPANEGKGARQRGLNTAPLPPSTFVERPKELDELKAWLLQERSEARGPRTAALNTAFQGGGGFGKTTLAQALCHDAQVEAAFSDAILWVELGETPEVTRLLARQAELLTGSRPTVTTVREGGEALRLALEDRAVLVVLDDVWNLEDARHFLQAGPRGAHLITTRNQQAASVLKAHTVSVNRMEPDEAARLLASGADTAASPELRELVRTLGGWALALDLAAAQLADLRNEGLSFDQAISKLRETLRQRGVTTLDAAAEINRRTSIGACLEVSLVRLGSPGRDLLLELAIFPEDTDVPFGAIDRLWAAKGMSVGDCEKLRRRARQLSLFDRVDGAGETLRLHDVVRTYLREQLGDGWSSTHARLINSWKPDGDDPLSGYFWANGSYHLVEGHDRSALRARLFDIAFLSTKLSATDTNALLADFAKLDLERDEPLRLLRDAIRLSANALDRRPEELPSQLFGRLGDSEIRELKVFAQGARGMAPRPGLVPLWPRIKRPGDGLVRSFIGHQSSVESVVFSQNGKIALSGSADGTLKLWEVDSGNVLRTFDGHQGMVTSVALSPDGNAALSGSWDGTMKLWNVDSGNVVHSFESDTKIVRTVAFSPDGKTALSSSDDGTLRLWDVSSRSLIRAFEGQQLGACSVAFSPGGKTALSVSWDKTLKLWDVGSGVLIRSFEGHTDIVRAVAFSPDGKTALSGSGDRTLKLWDVGSGSLVRSFEGHTSSVESVTFSPDGKTALSGSWDHTLKLWDVDSGSLVRSFEGHTSSVESVTFSPDGKTALSGSGDSTLKLWDVCSRVRSPTAHASTVESVAFSPDGKTALSGSEDGTVRLWDVGSGSVARSFKGRQWYVTSVAFSPDGKNALSGSGDKTVKLWDVASGSVVHSFEGHKGSVTSVAYSPNGKNALSGAWDRTVKLWDVASGTVVHTFKCHQFRVTSVAFSPDGKTALSACEGGTLKLLDVSSGSVIRSFEGHEFGVTSVAFSPDGRTALSASWDKKLNLWEVRSGSLLRSFEGHQAWVTSVAFSSDGKTALSASDDGTVKLWWMESAEAVATFTGDAAFRSVAWSPTNGDTVMAGDALGGVHFLAVTL
jgi:WD40 repeat protein